MSEDALRLVSGFVVDRNGANQAGLAAGVWNRTVFTTIRYDALREFHVGLGLSYFQPLRAGYYLLIGRASWITLFPPLSVFELAIRTVAGAYFVATQAEGHGSFIREIEVSTIQYLTPNDQVEMVTQTAAGVYSVDGNRYRTLFQAHRLA